MRVTIDLDTLEKQTLRRVCRKGKKVCGKRPDRIYRTRHGFHIIFDNVQREGRPITEEECIMLREKLGDDPRRVHLDSYTGRLHQVLFENKTYRVYQTPEDINGERKLERIESFKRIRVR